MPDLTNIQDSYQYEKDMNDAYDNYLKKEPSPCKEHNCIQCHVKWPIEFLNILFNHETEITEYTCDNCMDMMERDLLGFKNEKE